MGSRQQYSYPTLDQIRHHRDIFEGALGYTDCCGTAIFNVGSENQSADRQFVSGDFFTTLGVRAFRGRMLTPADDMPGAPEGPVAVVSYRLWHARLGARDDVIGARLTINRTPVTVVGVMPPTFFGVEVGRVLGPRAALSASGALHQHAARRRLSMVEHHDPIEGRPLRSSR